MLSNSFCHNINSPSLGFNPAVLGSERETKNMDNGPLKLGFGNTALVKRQEGEKSAMLMYCCKMISHSAQPH